MKIKIVAYFGDGVSAELTVSSEEWSGIENGDWFSAFVEYHYEGEVYEAWWTFSNGEFSIDGDDGRQCVNCAPLSELFIEEQ